jgi:hypothetical protein
MREIDGLACAGRWAGAWGPTWYPYKDLRSAYRARPGAYREVHGLRWGTSRCVLGLAETSLDGAKGELSNEGWHGLGTLGASRLGSLEHAAPSVCLISAQHGPSPRARSGLGPETIWADFGAGLGPGFGLGQVLSQVWALVWVPPKDVGLRRYVGLGLAHIGKFMGSDGELPDVC